MKKIILKSIDRNEILCIIITKNGNIKTGISSIR